MTTTYLSGDVEADGPIPGPFSMLSFGVVAFDESGKEIGAFSRNLELLPHALQHPKTMAWWAKNQAAYDLTRVGCVDPYAAMSEFDAWMRKLPGKKTFVGYPASYDFLFLYWYLMAFLGQGIDIDTGVRHAVDDYECPFGFQALDIKTLAMIPLGLDFRAVGKRKMPREWFVGQPAHTHDPLDDARGQGMLFFEVLRAARQVQSGAALTSPASTALALTERVRVLEQAIAAHRDQRGDDRCWLDDLDLYAKLGTNNPIGSALPPREEFLANCARFHASRQPEGLPYVSDRREIERLSTELDAVTGPSLAKAVGLRLALDEAAERGRHGG